MFKNWALDLVSTNVFHKGPDSEYFRLCKPYIYMGCITYSSCFACLLVFCFVFGFLQHSENVKTFLSSPDVQRTGHRLDLALSL